MPTDFAPGWSLLLLLGGFALLTVGAEALLRGSVRVARKFGLSDLVIGITLVALGTSAPELFVSLKASLSGEGAMAMGNVVGSNICNTLLVLGCGALFFPFTVDRKSHLPQATIAFAVTLLVLLFTCLGNNLERWEGGSLFAILLIWVLWSIRSGRQEKVVPEKPEAQVGMALPLACGLVIIGLVALWGGAEVTLSAAKDLARWIGLEERVIAVSIVALGTSLPELVTSLMAAIRKSPDLALGNVIGSNIFNLLCILGAASMARPIGGLEKSVQDLVLVGLVAVFLLVPIIFCRRIGRRWGVLAILFYCGCMAWLFWSGRI